MNYLRRMSLLCCMGLSTMVALKSQTFLQIHLADNIEKFPYDKVTEIQFGSDGISVLTEDDIHPYFYSEITKIDFGNGKTSGITIPVDEESSYRLNLYGNILYGSDGVDISVYNMLGMIVAEFKASGDISTLPAGIYIAISNGKKLKFVKK